MADIGLNFRGTSGYVTDGTGQTYVINGDNYSTNRGGATFGFVTMGNSPQDRDSAADPRVAGSWSASNAGTNGEFRIDLDAAGDYEIRLAVGDHVFGNANQHVIIQDNTTDVLTIDDATGTSANEWIDASGVLRTSETDWVNNNVAVTKTFSSTILRVIIGGPTSPSGSTTLAHIQVFGVPAISSVSTDDVIGATENPWTIAGSGFGTQ